MFGESPLDRLPAFAIAGLLALALVFTLFVFSSIGRRTVRKAPYRGLGPLEAMSSGLLALLLAFNFSVAQSRFDARQQLLVREADAIGTTYLRCSVLDPDERRICRDGLHRYAAERIAAYAAYGERDAAALSSSLAVGERIQAELWTLVARAARANPSPTNALLMSALNDVIDLDADRRASIRIEVPAAVSFAIMLACFAWAALLGYSSGARKVGSWTAWIVVAVLVSVVFGVALDLDRPRAGFVTTAAAERSTHDVLRFMEKPPDD